MENINCVWIVDDDTVYVFATRRLMEMSGFAHKVCVFKNGKDAIDEYERLLQGGEALPDVIFLDINMPILDGWQFLDRMTAASSEQTPIVHLVSSSLDPSDINRSKSYRSIKNYIPKPVTLQVLQDVKTAYQTSCS